MEFQAGMETLGDEMLARRQTGRHWGGEMRVDLEGGRAQKGGEGGAKSQSKGGRTA